MASEEKLALDIARLLKNLKQAQRVRDNIEKHFADSHDKGPVWIEEMTKGSAIQTLVDNVRQDSFDRISRLIQSN